MRITNRLGALCLASAASVAFSSSLQAGPLPDAVSAEVFAAPPALEDPQLSPSGSKLAVKLLIDGRQTLVVTPIAAGGAPASLGARDVDVNWWRWVNDDWLLIGLGDTQFVYNQEVYITRVMSVSADLKQVREIDWKRSGQFADDVLWTANDGSARFLLAKQTGFETEDDFGLSVFEADAASGHAKLLIGPRDGVYDWRADGNGNLRLGLAYDQTKDSYSVLYRPDNASSFSRLPDSADPGKGLPLPHIYRADGSALTIHDAGGFEEVYEMALPSFALGKKLFSAPGYDVSALALNPARDGAMGYGYVGAKSHWQWFSANHQTVQAALDSRFGKDNGQIVSQDRGGAKFLINAGGPDQAGGTYFWDLKGGAPSLVGWTNPALKDRKLSPVKTIRFKARDGTTIESVLTLPRGRPAANLPLIVMPHGGPGARDSEEFDWWTQFLAEQGYAVIQPNYRGSTGYGNAFYDLGKKEWGLKMQDDLVDAIAWASSEGIADKKRVCIVGASYGGYAAMRGAQRDSASYRCAISYAGVSDLKAMLRFDRKFFGERIKDYWKDRSSDFAAVSPLLHARDFGVPILIAHGVEDRRVPIKQSRMMVDELQKAGKPVTYLEQKEGDHHFSRTEDRLEFLNAMKAFLDKNNPA